MLLAVGMSQGMLLVRSGQVVRPSLKPRVEYDSHAVVATFTVLPDTLCAVLHDGFEIQFSSAKKYPII